MKDFVNRATVFLRLHWSASFSVGSFTIKRINGTERKVGKLYVERPVDAFSKCVLTFYHDCK